MIARRLALAIVIAIVFAPHVATSQPRAVVSGRVTVREAPGARTTDLENAVVWLEPTEGPIARGIPLEMQITMAERRFRPTVRVVPAGSSVRFPNDDPFRHNVFSDAGPSRFDLGLYGRGEARDTRFGLAGVYPVFCNIHARMVAYVIAVPTRWYAQAAPDGTYRIAEVPNGRYRLRAWHDRGGDRTIDIVVDGATATADVSLDARAWKPSPHKNKFGQDYPSDTRDRY